MDGREIQALRAMLAAQASEAAVERAKTRLFSRLLGDRADAGGATFGVQEAALQQAGVANDEALLLSEPLHAPLPAEILLGDLAPRRSAFGQRQQHALQLKEPAPREPARLMLTAPNGQAVGEVILHDPDAPRRRPFEAPQLETPFFPEDLEDVSDRRSLRRLTPLVPKKHAPALRTPRAVKPSRDVAATVLLAGLAARLAHEEAGLRARLAAAPGPSRPPPSRPG